MRILPVSIGVALFGLVLAYAPVAYADLFDFESLTPTYSPAANAPGEPDAPRPGTFTSLLLTGATVNVTVSRVGNQRFDLVANTGDQIDKPVSFGGVSLDPFFTTDGEIILNFSSPVTSISLSFGDYGDDADTLALSAFNGANLTGAVIATSLGSLPGNVSSDFTSDTISVSAPGIRSVRLSSGSSFGFTNSLFFDNLNVTSPVTVPEASTFALIGLALPIIGAVIARCRKH